jgi:hypothetical protein
VSLTDAASAPVGQGRGVTRSRIVPAAHRAESGPVVRPPSPSRRVRAAGLLLALGAMLTVACGSTSSTDLGAGGGTGATAPVEPTADPSPTADGAPGTDGTSEGTTPSSGKGATPPGAVDPCGVLAGIDVAALVGEPVAEPKGSDDLIGATCRVDPVSDSSAGLRVVVSDQEPEDNFENQRDVLGVDTEAKGIGDRAFHTGPYLVVLDGDRLVMIQVVRDSGTGFGVPDADLEAAARTILDNLAG